MDKELVRLQILKALRSELTAADNAAKTAHEAATNEESKAENKYDTRGLEASYLAEGQSRRVQGIEASIAAYENLRYELFTDDSSVQLSAVVLLESEQTPNYRVFVGPFGGGLRFNVDSTSITIVTPKSPLGLAIMGKEVGDEVIVHTTGQTIVYDVVSIC